VFLDRVQPEILILDNLGLFIHGDVKETEDVHQFYATLNELRRKHDCLKNGVILALHHLTKPNEYQPSLLDSPREFLARTRGSGRLLDYAQARLALAIESDDCDPFHVCNGIIRTGSVTPLLMQLNEETLCFEQHEDKRMVERNSSQDTRKGLKFSRACHPSSPLPRAGERAGQLNRPTTRLYKWL
jgi:hypothetical protein